MRILEILFLQHLYQLQQFLQQQHLLQQFRNLK